MNIRKSNSNVKDSPRRYKLSNFGEVPAPQRMALDEVTPGEVRSEQLSHSLRTRLETVGGDDPSRVDSGVFKSMLEEGLSAEDALATFTASARGQNARQRKEGHFDNYLQRTLREAVSKVKVKPRDPENIITVDFTGRHSDKANLRTNSGAILEQLHQIQPERMEWLWNPYVPLGGITILAGDPETGKSQIAIDLASRVSRMATMPMCDQRIRSNCIIATAEDHTSKTIVPRLRAAGADLAHVNTLRKVQPDLGLPPRYLSIPRDLQIIHDAIRDHSIKLFVLDPLNAFLGAATDTYRDHDIRLALGPLEDIAEALDCAIVIIAHLNKKEDAAALYRVGGSIGLVGAARSVLGVSKLRDDSGSVMYSLKNNLSRRPPALKYRILEVAIQDEDGVEIKTSHIKWIGQSDYDPQKTKGEAQELKDCREFLMTVLADGRVPSEEVKKEATASGVAWRTLNFYKHRLGVTPKKCDGKWYWVPPDKWSPRNEER